MELNAISTIFGIAGTISAVVFAVLAFRRNNKHDDTENGRESGVLLTEVGYIKAGVDDIKKRQERQDDKHIEVVERLSAVESSTEQAHKRIDNIETKINKQQ